MLDTSTLTLQKAKIDHAVEALFTTAKGRKLTDEEQHELDGHEKSLAAIDKRIGEGKHDEDFAATFAKLTGTTDGDGRPLLIGRVGGGKSFGQRYVESEAFAWHGKTKATRFRQWDLESVEIERKALTEDPASGGAVVVPDYQRTIVPATLRSSSPICSRRARRRRMSCPSWWRRALPMRRRRSPRVA